MIFEKYARPGKCEVCGKETDIVVVASSMGAMSCAYCKDCLEAGAEPYDVMVAYIACAGRFPDDINEQYREMVRANLAYLDKTEEQFIEDVDRTIRKTDEEYARFVEEHGGFKDSVGGWHEAGCGWDPTGEPCGECSNDDCGKCVVWERKQAERWGDQQ